MVLEKLIVFNEKNDLSCNCYLTGSDKKKKIFIIDPGAEHETIINRVMELKLKPMAIILTHAHVDHIGALREIKRHFRIPMWYNEKEFKVFIWKKADKWLKEGDVLKLGKVKFHVLETGGHSPGSISIYTKDINEFQGVKYDGIIIAGDAIFRRSIGRTDIPGGDERLLNSNIKEKIMYNQNLTDNFLVLTGHMGITTIGQEKRLNPFGKRFLKLEDWKQNNYFDQDIDKVLKIPPEERP